MKSRIDLINISDVVNLNARYESIGRYDEFIYVLHL